MKGLICLSCIKKLFTAIIANASYYNILLVSQGQDINYKKIDGVSHSIIFQNVLGSSSDY